MFRYRVLIPGLTLLLAATPLRAADPAGVSRPATHRIVAVTVYPNSALVTREVAVPEGIGSFELVVTPLPPQTVNSSLYSEGTDAIHVLTTRFRQRPIKEDTREEVRKLEAQLRQLNDTAQKLQSEMQVLTQNMQMLAKLEGFTGTTLQHLTDKGQLNSEATIALAKYIMDSRGEKADAQVANRLQQQLNQEQIQFTQRKLQEMAAGSNKTERDAVIVVEKKDAAPSKVRLNYLVNSAAWRPQYKFRAGDRNGKVHANGKANGNGNGKEKEAIQVEYLAAVMQQTGEDWTGVDLTLSTAQPMLNAAPPELKMLAVNVMPSRAIAANQPNGRAGAGKGGLKDGMAELGQLQKKATELRGAAQKEYLNRNTFGGEFNLNQAAAAEQASELLALRMEEIKEGQQPKAPNEGPSVTYHLAARLTIPSRNDEQVIEVARLDLAPDYFYKAVPVLTPHVYRLANLTNTSTYVLLPGEATMYLGSDFVGRANLPLVAIGEQFTAGFGVDPQLQVQRQLVDKSRTMQGDNQILRFEYRILVSSYKAEPAQVQLWDRLPHTETEAVGVNLVKAAPEVSKDPVYQRESRPHNLLRWDLTVAPSTTGEKALAINYEFRLEMGRQMQLGNFAAK